MESQRGFEVHARWQHAKCKELEIACHWTISIVLDMYRSLVNSTNYIFIWFICLCTITRYAIRLKDTVLVLVLAVLLHNFDICSKEPITSAWENETLQKIKILMWLIFRGELLLYHWPQLLKEELETPFEASRSTEKGCTTHPNVSRRSEVNLQQNEVFWVAFAFWGKKKTQHRLGWPWGRWWCR